MGENRCNFLRFSTFLLAALLLTPASVLLLGVLVLRPIRRPAAGALYCNSSSDFQASGVWETDSHWDMRKWQKMLDRCPIYTKLPKPIGCFKGKPQRPQGPCLLTDPLKEPGRFKHLKNSRILLAGDSTVRALVNLLKCIVSKVRIKVDFVYLSMPRDPQVFF